MVLKRSHSLTCLLVTTLAVACGEPPARMNASQIKSASADEVAVVRHGPDPDAATTQLPDDSFSAEVKSSLNTSDSGDNTAVQENDGVKAKEKVQAKVPTIEDTLIPVLTKAPVKVLTQAEKFLAMLTAKKLISTYNVMDAKGWGSSPDKRIEVLIAVDSAGKAIVPGNLKSEQAVATADIDGIFESDKGPNTALFSALKVCNKTAKTLLLHSGGNVFNHSGMAAAPGLCVQMLVINSKEFHDGDNYDHIAGGDKENWIYFKMTKIGPDGNVVP